MQLTSAAFFEYTGSDAPMCSFRTRLQGSQYQVCSDSTRTPVHMDHESSLHDCGAPRLRSDSGVCRANSSVCWLTMPPGVCVRPAACWQACRPELPDNSLRLIWRRIVWFDRLALVYCHPRLMPAPSSAATVVP